MPPATTKNLCVVTTGLGQRRRVQPQPQRPRDLRNASVSGLWPVEAATSRGRRVLKSRRGAASVCPISASAPPLGLLECAFLWFRGDPGRYGSLAHLYCAFGIAF